MCTSHDRGRSITQGTRPSIGPESFSPSADQTYLGTSLRGSAREWTLELRVGTLAGREQSHEGNDRSNGDGGS